MTERRRRKEALKAGFNADYEGALLRPSPNFGERRGGAAVSMLILHFTGMENAEAAERHLQDPAPANGQAVSAHYVVREDGAVVQMVAEAKRAWHAGQSFWQNERDINSRSIGIELINVGDKGADSAGNLPPYPAAQIEALIPLCRAIITRHAIKPPYVLAHSDIAPERKIDPGERFPWGALAAAGIGHYAPPAPLRPGPCYRLGDSGRPIEALQSMLALYGYHLAVSGVFDRQTEYAVKAFQRHFRPEKTDGAADISTLETLRALLETLPAA